MGAISQFLKEGMDGWMDGRLELARLTYQIFSSIKLICPVPFLGKTIADVVI